MSDVDPVLARAFASAADCAPGEAFVARVRRRVRRRRAIAATMIALAAAASAAGAGLTAWAFIDVSRHATATWSPGFCLLVAVVAALVSALTPLALRQLRS